MSAKKPENVLIYTTPTCVFCKAVKEYLTEHNVEYKEVDVAADAAAAEEMISKSGQMGVPVTMIDDQIIVGFNKPKFDQILAG